MSTLKTYEETLLKAEIYLKNHKLDDAKSLLEAISGEDEISSEVQNLTGIFYELKGEKDKAIRHYRAAYALDPTNACANDNIERLTAGPMLGKVKPIGYLERTI